MAKKFVRTVKSIWDKKLDKSEYNDSIVFIEDTNLIWSNNVYYSGVSPVINQSETTLEIKPNVLNVWGEVASLDITLATPSDTSIVNEYMIQFTSGATATQLALPDTIKWMNDPIINTNATYQLSIINNLAIIGEWSNE